MLNFFFHGSLLKLWRNTEIGNMHFDKQQTQTASPIYWLPSWPVMECLRMPDLHTCWLVIIN